MTLTGRLDLLGGGKGLQVGRSPARRAGVEDASAAVLSIFLSGALGSHVAPARA